MLLLNPNSLILFTNDWVLFLIEVVKQALRTTWTRSTVHTRGLLIVNFCTETKLWVRRLFFIYPPYRHSSFPCYIINLQSPVGFVYCLAPMVLILNRFRLWTGLLTSKIDFFTPSFDFVSFLVPLPLKYFIDWCDNDMVIYSDIIPYYQIVTFYFPIIWITLIKE